MATNLNLDDKVNAVENTSESAVGFANRLITLIKSGFKSDQNPFGDAATRDSWDGAGDVPSSVTGQLARLNSTGKIPGNMLEISETPTATKTQSGVVRAWDGTGSLPSDLDDDDVVPVLNSSGKTPDVLLPDTALKTGGPPDGLFEFRVTATKSGDQSATYDRSNVRISTSDRSSGGTLIPMTHKTRDAESVFGLASSGYVTIPAGSYFATASIIGDTDIRWIVLEHSDSDGSNAMRGPVALTSGNQISPRSAGEAMFTFTRNSAGHLRLKAVGSGSLDTSWYPYGEAAVLTAVLSWIKIWKTA